MKTKHILTVMALPALFAACTADEIETGNVATESQRPTLNGDLKLKIVEDVKSRYGVDESNRGTLNFKYENGDQIGAAIIDQFDSSYPTDPTEWPVISSQGGVCNPFVYNATAGEWSTINSIGVGHYIFVYPYNKTNVQRYAVAYNLPVIQELYQDEKGEVDLNAAIEKGNQAIYSTLLTADDLEVSATMRNMFAYPLFRVNIDNGEKVNTVSQIVLEYTDNNGDGFVVKSGLDHQMVYDLFADDKETGFYDEETEATDWDEVQTADLLLDENGKSFVEGGEIGTSKYLIAKFPEGTSFKIDGNTSNKYVDVRFMIPGAVDENPADGINEAYKGMKMHIYTDNGIYTINDVAEAIDFSKTTDKEVKERVFARNSSYSLTLNKNAVDPGKDNYIVTTVEDWNKLVKDYGASKNYTEDTPLSVSVIGDDFAFNADTEFPTVAKFLVGTPVKVQGEVEISNVTVNETVTVEEGATLTTSGTFSANKIENKGTLNIAPAYDKDQKVETYNAGTISNYGTLNINKETVASFNLFNAKGATVENEGEITVKTNESDCEEVTYQGSTSYYHGNVGTINNNGTIKSAGFVNAAPEKEYDKSKEEEVVVNMPTIVNNGTIRSTDKTLENAGTIKNNGTLTCRSMGGNIANSGVIESPVKAITYITDNTDGKVVVYTAIPNDNVVITNANGTVAYTATAATVSFVNNNIKSIVNDLTIEGTTTISNLGNIATLNVEGDATLTLPANAAIANVNANADLTLASSLTVGQKLTVAEDVTVVVNAGTTLTVSETMVNEGLIRVAGTFNAVKMVGTESGAGTVEESGSNTSQVIWGGYEAPLTGKQQAMKNAVEKWAGNWTNWMNNQPTTYYEGNPFDYSKFVNAMNVGGSWSTCKANLIAAGFTEANLATTNAVEPAEFAEAVTNFLKTKKEAAEAKLYDKDGKFVMTFGQRSVLYKADMKDLYSNMCLSINSQSNINTYFGNDATLAAYVWIDQANVFAKLQAKTPYVYIYDGCDLDKVMEVIASASDDVWKKLFDIEKLADTKTMAGVKEWMQYAANCTDSSVNGQAAKNIAATYATAVRSWDYSNDQVVAAYDANNK